MVPISSDALSACTISCIADGAICPSFQCRWNRTGGAGCGEFDSPRIRLFEVCRDRDRRRQRTIINGERKYGRSSLRGSKTEVFPRGRYARGGAGDRRTSEAVRRRHQIEARRSAASRIIPSNMAVSSSRARPACIISCIANIASCRSSIAPSSPIGRAGFGGSERAPAKERLDSMIAVIGCGNANRKDDAVGLEVISLLQRSSGTCATAPMLRLLNAGTDGMAVMFAARGCKTLLIVDSCRTGAAPGAIFEIPGGELESPHAPSLNLHDFRWDHALYAGRQMYRDDFPARCDRLPDRGDRISTLVSDSRPKSARRQRRLQPASETRIAVRSPAAAPAAQPRACREQDEPRHRAPRCLALHARDVRAVFQLSRQRRACFATAPISSCFRSVTKRQAATSSRFAPVAGDRTVMAADFFRDNGIEDAVEMTLPATWSEDRAALIVSQAFG